MTDLKIAEVFAGIGGVTGGFLDAGGYNSVLLNDIDPVARDVFAQNFPKLAHRYHVSRVERLTGMGLLSLADGEIDGVLGCPPCEGLSPVGRRDRDDERNQLLWQIHRLVSSIRPMFFVVENVPSLLQTALYRDFFESLSRRYLVHGEVLNAAEYGIPQLRRRAVVLGIRKDLGVRPSLPRATHGGRGVVYDYYALRYIAPRTPRGRRLLKLRPTVLLPKRSLVTLQDAIGDLCADLEPGEEATAYSRSASSPYQRFMRRGAGALTHHRAWKHNDDMVEFLRHVAPGECPGGHGGRARNTSYFSQAYARLHRNGLARTITKNFHNPGSGRFTHYAAPRTLTIREALRIQGFPDSFRFTEDAGASAAERLVGNAFPRPLARALARHIRGLLGV